MVLFRYRNADGDVGYRTVAPYIIYETFDGVVYLEGIDVVREAWRRFTIENVVHATVTREAFKPDKTFSPSMSRYTHVDCVVDLTN